MDRRTVLTAGVAVAAGATKTTAEAFSPVAQVAIGRRAERPKLGTYLRSSDGSALFYRDWGAGKPMVFASPWALGCDWWEYQMVFLANHGVRCIAYDRRSYDRSEQTHGGNDFDTLADDLDAVLKSLDLKDVTLVAYSMGSGEAVRYLSRHGGQRVSKLVLVAPSTPSVLKTLDVPTGFDPVFFLRYVTP